MEATERCAGLTPFPFIGGSGQLCDPKLPINHMGIDLTVAPNPAHAANTAMKIVLPAEHDRRGVANGQRSAIPREDGI
jgi:hypothetical protein